MIYIKQIAQSVIKGDDDTALNIIIQGHIDSFNIQTTVAQWRLDNYSELRRWAYPNPVDLSDSVIKMESGDPTLVTEGEAQRAQYVSDCLNVKTRFPKP